MKRPPLRLVEPPRAGGGSFVQRIIGVAKLQEPVYGEIKRDATALPQAVLIVVLAALATNVWVALFAPVGLIRAAGGVVLAVLAWLLTGALAWWVGMRWFSPRYALPDLRQMLALTGFAAAPTLLNIVGFLPGIGWLILMITSIWSLLAFYTAVRVGLAADERNGLAATFIAYLANALLFFLAANLLGIGRGGMLALP
ncbi:MAG: YIP1 family protein [Thermomicrobiales bacterium]